MSDRQWLLKKGECGECEKPQLLESLRRSGLDYYEKCPHLFKLIYIDKRENKSNLWARIGNILHDIFEKDSLAEEPFSQEYLEEMYKLNYELLLEQDKDLFEHAQKLVKGDIYENIATRASQSIQNYITYRKTANKIYNAEQQVRFSIGEGFPDITCTIDRINHLEGGGYEVVDYKTGKTYVGQKLKTDIQVPVYLMATHSLLGEWPERFTFFFTESGAERTYTRKTDDLYVCVVRKKEYEISISETIKRIRTIFANIQKERFDIPQKMNSYYCNNFCPAFMSGDCKGSYNQSWQNKNGFSW